MYCSLFTLLHDTLLCFTCSRALIGSDFLENQASEFAEAEYFSDIAAFGPMVEQAFNDVVLELIDTWAENAGQFFRSAFAWALFDW